MGLLTKTCPACGARVMRGFGTTCSQCGQAVHGLWKTCPSCRDMQPAKNTCCTRCGDEFPSTSPPVAGRVWRRTYVDRPGGPAPVELARHFTLEPGDLSAGWIVEGGLRAYLLHQGAVRLSVDAGSWTEQDLKTKLASSFPQAVQEQSLQQGQVAVLLVEAGDIVLDFSTGSGKKKLLTRDRQALRVEMHLVLRIDKVQPLWENVLKGQPDLTCNQLRQTLFPEVRDAVREFVASKDAGQLVSTGAALKRELEAGVREHLDPTLVRLGIALIQIRATDFDGEWIDQESELGRVVLAERRALAWEKLARIANDQTLTKAQLESQMAKMIADLEHDKRKRGVLHHEELEELRRTFGERTADHEVSRHRLAEKAELEHRFELEKVRIEGLHLEKEKAKREAEVARVRLEAELAAGRERAAAKREEKLADTLRDLEAQEKTAEVEDRIRKLKIERGFAARERKDQLDLKRRAEEQRMALAAERDRADLDSKRVAQQQDHETALLAAMQDWSEDKMLAWFSRQSEASAHALAARAQAAVQGQTKSERVLESTLERVLRVVERQGSPAVGVVPTVAYATQVALPPTAQVIKVRSCPSCRAESPVGPATHCDRCGTSFA